MLAQQFTEAVTGARTLAHLDNLVRLSWRAVSEGQLSDADAEALDLAVQARRARLKAAYPLSAKKPSTARKRPVSPDRRASLERRRRCALSGAVPSQLAAAFTMGELAALSVIAAEVKRRGRCELPIDAVAAMAGVCRSVVQNAAREASRLGLISVRERRHRGQRSETNVVEVIAPEWRAWLKLGSSSGGRVQKKKHHGNQLVSSCGQALSPRLFGAQTMPGSAMIRPTQTQPDTRPYGHKGNRQKR